MMLFISRKGFIPQQMIRKVVMPLPIQMKAEDSETEGIHAATNQKKVYKLQPIISKLFFKAAINSKEGFKPRLIRGKVVMVQSLRTRGCHTKSVQNEDCHSATCARNYRPSFSENQPKTLVFNY